MSLWPFAASPRGRSTDAAPRHDAAPVWSAGPVACATEQLEDRLLLFVTLGGKWGSPQFGTSAEVTYSFIEDDVTDQEGDTLSGIETIADGAFQRDELITVFQEAFDRWADFGGLRFEQVFDNGLDSTDPDADSIDIRIGARNIDGPNGILAFAFPPPDENDGFVDPINGDITFDISEDWVLRPDGAGSVDVFTTALHEIGHSLGLGHTPELGNIMEPIFDPTTVDLGEDDINGIQFIYGPALGQEFGLGLFTANGGGNIDNGTAGGNFRFGSNDVVTLVVGADEAFRYETYFDGSDVGLDDDVQITGISLTEGGDLLMTFDQRVDVGGFTFDTNDVVRFRFADGAGGAATDGAFDFYLDGSDVGLSNVVIDGFSVEADGSLFITSRAGGSVAGVGTFDGNDILLFSQTSLGEDSDGTFSFVLDGSDVGLTGLGESIDGFDVNGPQLSLTTRGGFTVPGLVGNSADVVNFTFAVRGEDTAGVFDPDLVIDSEFFGLDGVNVTGFHLGPIVLNDGDVFDDGGDGGAFDPGFDGGVFPRPPVGRPPERPDFPWGPGGGVNPDFPTFPDRPVFPGFDTPDVDDRGGEGPKIPGGDDETDDGGATNPDGGGNTTGGGFTPFGGDWRPDFRPDFPGWGGPNGPADRPEDDGRPGDHGDEDEEDGGNGGGDLDGDFDGDGDVDEDDERLRDEFEKDLLGNLFGGGFFGGGF